MFADRYVERVEMESKRQPADVSDALRKDAEDWHGTKFVQYPLERAIRGLSIKGDQHGFRIRMRPFSVPAECVGSIESVSSGSRLSAELRFANSTYIGVFIWIVLGAGALFYDAYWGGRAPNTLTVLLIYAAVLLVFMTGFSLLILHLWWRRIAPVRIEFRELLLRAVEGTPPTLSTLDSSHEQVDAS